MNFSAFGVRVNNSNSSSIAGSGSPNSIALLNSSSASVESCSVLSECDSALSSLNLLISGDAK